MFRGVFPVDGVLDVVLCEVPAGVLKAVPVGVSSVSRMAIRKCFVKCSVRCFDGSSGCAVPVRSLRSRFGVCTAGRSGWWLIYRPGSCSRLHSRGLSRYVLADQTGDWLNDGGAKRWLEE